MGDVVDNTVERTMQKLKLPLSLFVTVANAWKVYSRDMLLWVCFLVYPFHGMFRY